jgi:hypothetical protein
MIKTNRNVNIDGIPHGVGRATTAAARDSWRAGKIHGGKHYSAPSSSSTRCRHLSLLLVLLVELP